MSGPAFFFAIANQKSNNSIESLPRLTSLGLEFGIASEG